VAIFFRRCAVAHSGRFTKWSAVWDCAQLGSSRVVKGKMATGGNAINLKGKRPSHNV
jgi:hypothetical protein